MMSTPSTRTCTTSQLPLSEPPTGAAHLYRTRCLTDFLRRQVHVRHQLVSVPGVAAHLGPPKTASSLRTVPAPDFVLSALAEHLRVFEPGPFGMIFSNKRGMAVNRQSLHRSLAAAVRAAGLPAGITFHQLRHTYASLLIDGGESVTVVADRMGT